MAVGDKRFIFDSVFDANSTQVCNQSSLILVSGYPILYFMHRLLCFRVLLLVSTSLIKSLGLYFA